jgi:hypothetical protein
MNRTIPAPVRILAILSFLAGLLAFVPVSAAGDFFLHSSTNDFLDNISPPATTAKFKDSPAVNRTTYQEIGTWAAAPGSTAIRLNSLSDLHVWIGLRNSDDQGTFFDLRAELRRNGAVIASGETKNIQGVTRNPNNAKEVTVSFGPVSVDQVNPGDVLSIRVLTKVADSGGHNNAVGLRLYYDAVSRPSKFGAAFVVDDTPPAIAAAVNPAPNAAGWHKSDATVSFTCSDAGSGIGSCSAPVVVATEGAGQVISGTAVDQTGNSAMTSVTLNIDKTPPVITITSPANGATIVASVVTVTGTITETLSGVASVACNGNPGTPSGLTFSCNVQLANGPNTIVVDAIDVAGNIGSSSISVNHVAGPGIAITSPAHGAAVPAGQLIVTGMVTNSSGVEFGVTVNSIPAAIQGSTFIALIYVNSDTSSIAATATTATGTTASETIAITVTGAAGSFVGLRATPFSGPAPLVVNFSLSSDSVVAQVSLDANGDGIIDYTGPQLDQSQFTFTQPGVYLANATATSAQGSQVTASALIQVFDATQLDGLLRAKWAALRDALRGGDINAALSQIAQRARSRYEEGFQIIFAQLPNIDQILTNISLIEFRENEAIYDATRIDEGLPMAFEVRFVIDGDGVWRVRSF